MSIDKYIISLQVGKYYSGMELEKHPYTEKSDEIQFKDKFIAGDFYCDNYWYFKFENNKYINIEIDELYKDFLKGKEIEEVNNDRIKPFPKDIKAWSEKTGKTLLFCNTTAEGKHTAQIQF